MRFAAIPDTPSINARTLLADAAALFDQSDELADAAKRASRGGFAGGAEWMRHALDQLRQQSISSKAKNFQLFGVIKYGLATTAALLFAAALLCTGRPILIAAAVLGSPLVFYAVEAQMVFLFPLMLDDSRRPFRDSLRWTRRAGGTVAVMCTVMRLALTMLFGGLLGGGFVRSWCLGCLAVCIWYERLRQTPAVRRPNRLFSFGTCGPLLGRRETLGGWNLPRPLRILYISDLHLGRPWTNAAAVQSVRIARETRPDVILLGGDLLDCSTGAPVLQRCTTLLTRTAAVYAVPGNHDRRAGLDAARDAVMAGGATWLDRTITLEHFGIALLNEVGPPSSLRTILCGHNPSIFSQAAEASIDLTFAGHLHGGQCVLFERKQRLYPGAWFAKWTGLRFRRGASTLLVSRGAADTLPIRWNCPREVILCEIS